MINPFINFAQTVQQFQQFKQSFQGDPKQQVQQMLNSGQITQDQLNKIMPFAQQMYQMLGGRKM